VKGMHWGVRRNGGGSDSSVSADSARAEASKAIVKKHGTKALSNDELKNLVNRLNLESQYGKLQPEEVNRGKKIMSGLLGVGGDVAGNVAKQQATSFANKYAAQGISHLINEASKASKHHSNNAPLKLISIG
jgi:hypothetical protein